MATRRNRASDGTGIGYGVTMQYRGNPAWPGLWEPVEGCGPAGGWCSWAYHGGHGRMEVKYVNALCGHAALTAARYAGQGAGGHE